MGTFIFSASVSEAFPIITRTEQGIIISYMRLLVKHPLVLSDFNETWTSCAAHNTHAALRHAATSYNLYNDVILLSVWT